MSREIKFRAWVRGANIPYMASWNDLSDGKSFGWPFEDENLTLTQFTGLKDRHGVEIYEGDIIEDMMYVKWCDVKGGFQPHMSWYGGNECMACGGDSFWWEVVSDHDGYEVIGNIYENPELLEQTNERKA